MGLRCHTHPSLVAHTQRTLYVLLYEACALYEAPVKCGFCSMHETTNWQLIAPKLNEVYNHRYYRPVTGIGNGAINARNARTPRYARDGKGRPEVLSFFWLRYGFPFLFSLSFEAIGAVLEDPSFSTTSPVAVNALQSAKVLQDWCASEN